MKSTKLTISYLFLIMYGLFNTNAHCAYRNLSDEQIVTLLLLKKKLAMNKAKKQEQARKLAKKKQALAKKQAFAKRQAAAKKKQLAAQKAKKKSGIKKRFVGISKISNPAQFNKLLKNNIVIVDFYGDYCHPCKALSGPFENLARKYTNLNFAKVNAEFNENLIIKNRIKQIPTIVVFRNGREVHRMVNPNIKSVENVIKKYSF